eukprot:2797965-Prymnesium_polylepis.1
MLSGRLHNACNTTVQPSTPSSFPRSLHSISLPMALVEVKYLASGAATAGPKPCRVIQHDN